MIQVAIEKYKQVQELNWNEAEKSSGKTIKIKGFPHSKAFSVYYCRALIINFSVYS